MMAISVVDCALWDLKGRVLGVPVYTLLGGPTREKVPAYASMLGFNVADTGLVRERAAWAKSLGLYGSEMVFQARADVWARGVKGECGDGGDTT